MFAIISEYTYNVVNIFIRNSVFLHSLLEKVYSQFQTKVLFLHLCNLLQMQMLFQYTGTDHTESYTAR